MMTKLVEIANKNFILGLLIKTLVFCGLKFISFMDEMGGCLRVKFGIRDLYSPIKQYKNKYFGKRCFIICTGPSLRLTDLEKLKKEYTFCMNSICLLKDKTDFRPTFYGCIDEGVYKKLRKEILDYCNDRTDVFVSNRIARIGELPFGWKVVPVNVAYHTYDRWFKNKFWCKFSDDCYRLVYDMYSVTHFLIQLAVYMGFKEIYLLGADCSFPKNKPIHFQDYGVPDTSIDTAYERNIAGYQEVKKYCDCHDVKVYNATRGGELKVFEKVDFGYVVER